MANQRVTVLRAIVALGFLVPAGCTGGGSSTPTTDTPPGVVTTDAILTPEAFAMDVDGRILFSDCAAQRVFRLGADDQVEVVAGSGPAGFDAGGFAGDGGPATQARLSCPGGIAVDRAGNVFVADTLNNRVRKIDTSGVITTYAGSGETGPDTGDGGPAGGATLDAPYGLAFDADENLYVTDPGNDVIRKIDPGGAISTVAGTGRAGFSGDGGPATGAELHTPWSIVFDRAGDLYFTDKGNGRVRMIDTGGTISTIAGDGVGNALIPDPYGLAIDSDGRLLVSDDVQAVVRRIDGDAVTTIAGTRAVGTRPPLSAPSGLFMDPSGNLYVADAGNSCVRVIDPGGTITSAVCGERPAAP